MGCGTSRSSEEDDDVVALCRERKRLIKSAVDYRLALADAHCKYNQSLYAVALAIRLFVARHSSPSSPFLITFPQNSDPPIGMDKSPIGTVVNPMYLHQTPSNSTTHKANSCESPIGTVSSHPPNPERKNPIAEKDENDDDDEDSDDEDEIQLCEHFYGDLDPQMPLPQENFGWDFFNSYGLRTEIVHDHGFDQNSDEVLRAVREAEGIPELEEEDGVGESLRERKLEMAENGGQGDDQGKKDTVVDANVRQVEQKGLKVIGNSSSPSSHGRELLEALKDVEDHFIRAYDSGGDVCKMLETSLVHLQSGVEDQIKENSNRLIQSIPWHRSISSRSSSRRSFLASSSRSSSTWTEFKNDVLDDYQGMVSGCHSSTLGRLYAWEKKLYEEVKGGEQTRKNYEKKCLQLRNQEARAGLHSLDRTEAEVRDLHSRILVATRTAESIATRIQKLRDDELQPQLIELLHGLMRAWKIMSDAHEIQKRIMFEVNSFTCPGNGLFCNESHRLATLQLEAEIHNWRACFVSYVSAQKSYVEALYGWLSKFVVPEVEFYSQHQIHGPPLLVICHDWLTSLQKLPEKSVKYAMRSLEKDVQALWSQQGDEQQQKRKVDGLTKELNRRVLTFQKAEGKIMEPKVSEQKGEIDMRHRFDYLEERKTFLDLFRKRLDAEKAKHQDSMHATQRITLNGFQTGFSSVFESLIEFSKASENMYADLVMYTESARMLEGESEHVPSIEG